MKSMFKHAAGLQSQFFVDVANEVEEEIGDASDDAIEKAFKSRKFAKEVVKLIIANAKLSLSSFFSGSGPIKLYFGDNFKNWILSQKFEYISGLPESRKHILPKAMSDGEIIKEFGVQPYRSISELLTAIHNKLMKQPNGEDGELLSNGYANLFYLELNGRVVVVDLDWRSGNREWICHAYGLAAYRWLGGRRAFSRS